MQNFARILALTAPLFLLVLLGYTLTRWGRWPKPVADALTRFVFSVAIPALLFRLMSDFSRLPPVDARLLIAYFGACMLVFLLGRLIAARLFRMDGVAQAIFGLGGIFANNVMLGIPLAKVTLGEPSLPVISLVLVFNALVLWTLVTVSVEWARRRALSWSGYMQAAKGVLANPVVASILLGTGPSPRCPGCAFRRVQTSEEVRSHRSRDERNAGPLQPTERAGSGPLRSLPPA